MIDARMTMNIVELRIPGLEEETLSSQKMELKATTRSTRQ
jgi:hypothetical protein